MQAVIAVKIGPFRSLLERDGLVKAVQSASQFVAKAKGILGNHVFDIRGDMVLATASDIPKAISLTGNLKHIHPNVSIAIGYGDLYQTVDGIYWGTEIEEVIRLLICNGTSGETLLTSNANLQ